MTDDIDADLELYAAQSDEDIDMGALALVMLKPVGEHSSFDRYIQHFNKIKQEVKSRHGELISNGALDDVGTSLAALKHVLSDKYDYRADDSNHEIMESADIRRVIDRGQGCSTALCILYMVGARGQGWLIEGLDFLDKFLCRIEIGGERLIFDPAQQCSVLQAHDLRAIIKDALGDTAELSSNYLDGLRARQSIIHLFNHIKTRYIEMGDYDAALDLILRMRRIAPDEYRLLLDAGVLYARAGRSEQAISCLNDYMNRAPMGIDLHDARLLLDELLV